MSKQARELLCFRTWCEYCVDQQAHLSARDVWAFHQLRELAAHLIGFLA